jgi:hypothetical protein
MTRALGAVDSILTLPISGLFFYAVVMPRASHIDFCDARYHDTREVITS